MNPKPITETEAIRSDIEMTRRRMDDTMNALGERMQGRHILDEVIGFFRSNSDKTRETGERVREKLSDTAGKISDSAGSAASAVVDTVKKNPLPFLMITAGAAWLAYSLTRDRGSEPEVDEDLEDTGRYDPDTHYDRPLAYPGTEGTAFASSEETGEEGSSKFDEMKEKASAATSQVKQKLSDLGDQARDKMQSVKERASEIGSKVQDRTKEMYGKSRDQVARTANEHPLEVGLGCLAAGVLIGLALPTPKPVHRIAGPTVDRLRNRTRDAGRDVLNKGKRVVQAATQAAKDEAESQGLTPDRLRASGRAIGERAEEAASDAMKEDSGAACDINPSDSQNRTSAERADPSAARPAM